MGVQSGVGAEEFRVLGLGFRVGTGRGSEVEGETEAVWYPPARVGIGWKLFVDEELRKLDLFGNFRF